MNRIIKTANLGRINLRGKVLFYLIDCYWLLAWLVYFLLGSLNNFGRKVRGEVVREKKKWRMKGTEGNEDKRSRDERRERKSSEEIRVKNKNW